MNVAGVRAIRVKLSVYVLGSAALLLAPGALPRAGAQDAPPPSPPPPPSGPTDPSDRPGMP
ncbi:MAG: hypothetical protein ACYTGG_10450, partial [Planctomycetota bacterium]